ncbi:BTAD domain-containing putative transcriptional regulator [Streptantibioticus ferralitis]|uniref:BTAD domain-containing putative transcriptional regulator n=1 Tax=Streptantibioticus ferralitis TaxID=236510 RepID=A0ABT5Z3J7_9ACTN|nr:BTAD domain-containing putative transcriptional regulator [Streptantibioticus ferralitis]MDF2258401.1 BTAD domain-containing putative transcriptional regulator [Streptantibioticus ferralitis]
MARGTATGRPGQPSRPVRTAGDFLRAGAAFLALAVLVVGVPGALAYFIGWPLPHSMPSASTLKDPITASTFVRVLAIVVWLAWAQFTACVLVEAKAAISGVGMPTRIPGAGPSQLLARQLIAALLLVGATAASLTPGLSSLGGKYDGQPARHGSVATAQHQPGQQHRQTLPGQPVAQVQHHGQQTGHGSSTQADKPTKFYRITPPEGRHHDSLWEVAQRHLGDGRRYKEIYELNKDRVQPDGSRLSEASLIRPGWIMEMPGDARGGDLVEVPDPTPHVSPEEQHQVQQYDKSGTHHQHAQQQHQQPAHHEQAKPAPEHPAEQPHTTTSTGDSQDTGLPEALIASPLLAAGLLAALGRRRRTALLQAAAAGIRTSLRQPRTGAEADTQDALRIGADPDGVAFLDRALRALSAALADAGRPLPIVHAAWTTEEALHIQLASSTSEPPPTPWHLGHDQSVWSLDRTELAPDAEQSPIAPYPGLASLGTLDGSRLLLNLEAAPGILTLTGAPTDREAVLASIATELATNGWSDRMTVTLVGFGEQLDALAPTRARHLPNLDELLEAMEAETAQRRAALATAGYDTVLTGRTGLPQHTQWAPHLVLLVSDLTPQQAERLARLASRSSSLGIGYLVATEQKDLPGTAWQFDITPDGRLLAPLLGLELQAQRLPRAQYEAVLQLFKAADSPDRPDPDPTAPPVLVDLSDQGRPAVYARLMGPFEVNGLEPLDADRSVLAHEALALLLLHREGLHPRVLASALWPRGATEDVRDAVIERLRTWLGTDSDGAPRLRTAGDGRLSLSASVVSDWDVLQTLRHEAERGRGRRDRGIRRRLLKDALALARGPLLAGRPEGRYSWLTHEIAEAQLPLMVTEIALALSEEYAELDKPESSINAIHAGMRVAPNDERSWNALLRAVHATGDEARLRATAEDLSVRAADHHGARGLPPRTQALLDELLPTWRGGQIAN